MSQENVDRFLEAIEAFNRGDLERWLEAFHPDAVLELQNAELEGDYSGHDDLRRFFPDFTESFEMFEVRCTDVRDLGDRVVALGTLRTIGRGSRIENEGPVAFVASYRDGVCTHLKDYGEWGSTSRGRRAFGVGLPREATPPGLQATVTTRGNTPHLACWKKSRVARTPYPSMTSWGLGCGQ
jgi:ketosteroid isomerase-like protein